MKRILDFFQSLRGKLILTYTVVTVLALLALEIIILTIAFGISGGIDTDTRSYLSDILDVLPPQARPYLQPGDEDLPGLQSWLQLTYENGFASLPAQGILDSPAAPIAKPNPMYVLSPNNVVLAASPASAKSMVGREYTPPENVTNSDEILKNAQGFDRDVSNLFAETSDGYYWLAVPIQQEVRAGPLVGVIIVTVEGPPGGLVDRWPELMKIVLITAVILLLAVAPFGAIFGFIMSKNLTRRLKALTMAADAWSEGDFSLKPQDRSKDELSYLSSRLQRMAENIQSLMQTKKELALLEERNRLARELHDTVKQETFATLMQVRSAKNLLDEDLPAARDRLNEAEKLIKSSQQDLGQIISALRPAALEGHGLATALRDYLVGWSQRSRIPTDFQVQNEQRLPLEIEQVFLRVMQEALANVSRHSRASAVTMRLVYDAGKVALTITDNGVGFDPSSPVSGFGLQSMRERMISIQGELVIRTAPENGTIITAIAPIPHQE